MNKEVFLTIYSWTGHWPWLDALMIFMAEYAILLVGLAFLLIFWWHSSKRMHRFFVKATLTIIGVWAVHWIIKFFTAVPRPFAALDTTPLIKESLEHSFPSGHAAVTFALAVAMCLAPTENKTYRYLASAIFLIFAVLISFARVYVGVHWPWDALAGAALGSLGAFAILGKRT